MKNTRYIKLAALLLFTLIQLRAVSQAIGHETNQFENTFTSKKLSSFHLKGFENRAIQKIKDFGDYISLLSNKEYDIKLRNQAIQMFKGLFVDNNVVINHPEKELKNAKSINVSDYAKAIIECKFSKIEVKISDIQLMESLQPAKNGTYKGVISFKQQNQYYKGKSQTNRSISSKKVEIILVKTTKKFGSKKEQVWNVFLGEISGN